MSDRKHLTPGEVEKLLAATKGAAQEARDRCMLLLMFRHGLRVSEACGLKLLQVDVEGRVLHVARLKRGLSTTNPLRTVMIDDDEDFRAWRLSIRAGNQNNTQENRHVC
jgi:type 1 fimbriae regulatory protein FimB